VVVGLPGGMISNRRGGIEKKASARAPAAGTGWYLTCPTLGGEGSGAEAASRRGTRGNGALDLVLVLHGVSVGGVAAGTDAANVIFSIVHLVMMLFLFQSFEVFRRLYRDPQQIHRIDPRLIRPPVVGHHKNMKTRHCLKPDKS